MLAIANANKVKVNNGAQKENNFCTIIMGISIKPSTAVCVYDSKYIINILKAKLFLIINLRKKKVFPNDRFEFRYFISI